MAAPLPLRTDVTADAVRRHSRRARDANQARRLLALAAHYEGSSRSDAARIGGVGLQIVRDWVVRFNAAGSDGLIDRKASDPSPRLNEAQRQALAAAVERGPIPSVQGVVRWRLADLAQWVWEEFRPVGLNNAGQIVGAFEGGMLSFVGTPRAVQPVPEPSSLALFGVGSWVLRMGRGA